MTLNQERRFAFLRAKVIENIDEAGIKLDLNCPCDRAILSECGLTEAEAFELLTLFDCRLGTTEDDTRRVAVGKW